MPRDVGRSAWRGRISRSDKFARPPILSYAQNAEDVVLSPTFADQEFGFYVDIGACHPVEDSVTLHFYERGWHRVNVEPDRELHALFLGARPRDINLCAADGRPRGRVAFHPACARGHGTLDATLASARCGLLLPRLGAPANKNATAEVERLGAELDAALNRNDALVVDAARARGEAAAPLRREERPEARMASFEMGLGRREAADLSGRARNLFERIFFRPDGRPVERLRRLLFQTSGAPRRFSSALWCFMRTESREAHSRTGWGAGNI